MKNHSLIYLFIFSLLMLSACITPTENPAAEETSIPLATQEPEIAYPSPNPTAAPGRYDFKDGKFSLALPQGWSVLGPLKSSGDDLPPYDIYILGKKPTASGGPGSSMIIIADTDQWTAEQFVQSQCSTCPEHPFEDTTLGEKKALRIQVGGGGVPILVTWDFVENNDKLIGLAIHDPETLEPLTDVLQSIRFQQ